MPENAGQIVRALQLRQVDEDRYLGGAPDCSQLEKTFGGHLLAQALVAAGRTAPPDRLAHSLQTVFLKAGDTDCETTFAVERVRDGRSFSSRLVHAEQHGSTVLTLSASFQAPEPGLHHAIAMPQVPEPESLPPMYEVIREVGAISHEFWRDEWAALDLRYIPDNLTGPGGQAPGRQQVWMRVRDRLPDDPGLHRAVIAYLSDLTLLGAALVPHGFLIGAPELPRATLNHSAWFHADARADEWLLFDQQSPWAGGALGLSLAAIHTASGTLVGTLAQEGLIRPRGALRTDLGL